jgi:hypothetical protein
MKDFSKWKGVILTFNEHKHNMALVVAAANSCPIIKVYLSEMILAENSFGLFNVNKIVEDINDMPIFYKHNNQWMVFSGDSVVKAAKENNKSEVSGMLLSSFALKKCRIIPPNAEVVSQAAPASNEPLTRGYHSFPHIPKRETWGELKKSSTKSYP